MQIAIDKNILFAKEAFETLGEAQLFEQKDLTCENIRDFDALIVRSTTKIDENLLSGTNIKFVGSAVGGTDHIDTEYLQKADIAFSAATGCNSRSVAEYALTAIYAFCEKKGLLPQNQTVGIIGVGNIGGMLAEILKNLGIKTILNDPIREKTGEKGFSSLDFLAQNSDIITVHVPLTKSGEYKTQNLLDGKFFAKIKDGALLIQASRGTVCDEEALLKASPKMEAPVIDVWANEPDINIDLAKNCMFHTPHIAGHSFDGKINGTKMIYDACCAHFSKMPIFDFESKVFAKIETRTIEFGNSISEILLKCCPLDCDTRSFECILSEKDVENRKKMFKKLRQNYQKRLEFKHYSIKNAPEKLRNELEILGFNVLK
ncbi:MAG: 4-phosphoerythronate dehydrogenase [Chitinivibrionia bacterium]|nr:4-phosphoerythronate dehydrogenase [Chitinivibrionia bacterium]